MPVVLIDNYDSFTYNLYQLIQSLTEDTVEVYRNDAISLDEIAARQPSHIVLSPGPGHPGNSSDFGVGEAVIRNQTALNCPVLGVCLGHQGIIHHLGGMIDRAPRIMHGKTSLISKVEPSVLLEGLPNPFQAMRYHSLIGVEDKLPDNLKVIARETVDGLVMAIEHTQQPLYGVQFHPESIGTPEGHQLIRNFLERC